MRCPAPALLVAALFALVPAALAQDAAPPDTVFQARIGELWDEARAYDGEAQDSLWRALAAEPFAYYRAHPNTPTGRDAARVAFTMWGNTDAVDEVTAAMAHLDDGSEVWARALHGIANAHWRADRADEYAALLHDLEGRLTHPVARTAVLSQLGERALRDGRDAEARPYFEAVVSADADSFRVAAAEGSLYEIDHLAVGMEAPDFEALTLDGEPLRLSDLRGRVVLLDFWATWCGPCIPELEHLAETAGEHRGDAFALVGVSLDRDRSDLVAMVEDRDLDWPHVWQEGAWEGEIARLYNVRSIPQTYLLDRDGRIVAKDVRGEGIEEAVAALVED